VNRGVFVLLGAQFLSAFADNAILFTAIAMLIDAPRGAWYVPALQGAFLVAFVVLAPWVGPFVDRRPKPHVLLIGNIFKAVGAGLMLLSVEPIVAYALVGIGAAIYGPAKYGILPEMVGHNALVRANGLIEGSTIVAIIAGTAVGAYIADRSVTIALAVVVLCYVVSAMATFWLPSVTPKHLRDPLGPRRFIDMMRKLFVSDRARFSMLGTSLFWASAAVLRLMLVAWAPLVLATRSASDVAEITVFLALGISAGAFAVPLLIPMDHLRRARLAAYAMGICILVFSQTDSIWPARIALVAIGIAGGMFMVPVNAALQDIGYKSIGSGGAVALQNFFENLAMLIAVAMYTVAAKVGVGPIESIVTVGVLVLIATFIVSWHLPPDPARK
jgi:LPLT family lysophospholipid transporter-like MFS transporter